MNQHQDNEISIKLINAYLPNKINNELIVASFSQLAVDPALNCTFKGASFQKPAVSKKITSLNANIQAVGFSAEFVCKIGAIQNLYKKIIDLPVLMNIDGISYTNKIDASNKSTSTFDTFTVDFSGESYYWNSPTISNSLLTQ